MRNYLIVGAIVLISIIGIWLLAADSDDQSANSDAETSTTQEPESFDPGFSEADNMEYSSQHNPDLSLSYPGNWNVTEDAENSFQEQLVTLESPRDANGYYFCLDLTEVSAASDLEFATTGANVLSVDTFTAESANGDLSSIIFNVEDGGNLLWSVVDSPAEPGDNEFSNQITNASERRLQTLGRFNCRETDLAVTDEQQFVNSRWFNQAQAILGSLTY